MQRALEQTAAEDTEAEEAKPGLKESHERLARAVSENDGDIERSIAASGLSRSAAYRALTLRGVRRRVEELEAARYPWMRVQALRTLESALRSERPHIALAAAQAILKVTDESAEVTDRKGVSRPRRMVFAVED